MLVPISIKFNHSEILTFKRWNVIIQHLEERIEELKNKGYDVRYEIDTGYHNGVTDMSKDIIIALYDVCGNLYFSCRTGAHNINWHEYIKEIDEILDWYTTF